MNVKRRVYTVTTYTCNACEREVEITSDDPQPSPPLGWVPLAIGETFDDAWHCSKACAMRATEAYVDDYLARSVEVTA
jgi:hypothetical protein